VCWQICHFLASSPLAPHEARTLAVTDIGQALGAPEADILNDVALIVSELVTNAVQAGSGAVLTRLELHRDTLHIAITDSAAGRPASKSPSATTTSGRGLLIVDHLAIDWGVTYIEDGKTVWAVLPLPQDLTSALACTG
jgi:anti-sigma regulatory factor (Ser/Thr protein kinase)